jgi:hypothetical protein
VLGGQRSSASQPEAEKVLLWPQAWLKGIGPCAQSGACLCSAMRSEDEEAHDGVNYHGPGLLRHDPLAIQYEFCLYVTHIREDLLTGGSGRLLSPFTRRFRLGFALLPGGSRIDHHNRAALPRSSTVPAGRAARVLGRSWSARRKLQPGAARREGR